MGTPCSGGPQARRPSRCGRGTGRIRRRARGGRRRWRRGGASWQFLPSRRLSFRASFVGCTARHRGHRVASVRPSNVTTGSGLGHRHTAANPVTRKAHCPPHTVQRRGSTSVNSAAASKPSASTAPRRTTRPRWRSRARARNACRSEHPISAATETTGAVPPRRRSALVHSASAPAPSMAAHRGHASAPLLFGSPHSHSQDRHAMVSPPSAPTRAPRSRCSRCDRRSTPAASHSVAPVP